MCIKLVNKFKYKSTREVDHCKERFVVKRYKQNTGIDYFKVFAPVIRLDIVRMIIFIATNNS